MLLPLALLAFQQPQPQPSVPAARIVVSPSNRSVVVGDTLRLRVQVLDSAGRAVPRARVLFYSPSGGEEGTIDTSGVVHAGAPGSLPVAISVIVPGQRPKVENLVVEMVPGPATRVTLTPDVRRLANGQSIRLEARSYSARGDLRHDSFTWRSSAPNVARVADGIVTAVGAGRATISATAGGASQSTMIEVAAQRVASVTVTPVMTEARTGDVVRLTAVAKDAQGREIAGLVPTWSSTGRSEVGSDGAFVGYDAGRYDVTASFGSAAGSTSLTLAARDVKRPAMVVGKVPRGAFMTSEVWLHPSGNIAYLATAIEGDRVYTIDISNPASPTVVDSISIDARHINDVMTTPDGNYLVMTREGSSKRQNGIVIADARDPLHPKQLAEFTEGVTGGVHSAFVHHQAKYGTQVYLTNDATGALHIVDITDPAKPKELSRWAPPEHAGRYLHDVDVQDGLLYASWWNDGLIILDVGNGIKGGSPSNPQLVSQYKYDLATMYRDVEREVGKGFIRGTHTAFRRGRYVFIGDEVFGLSDLQKLLTGNPGRAYGRLQVIDVSDVTNPKSVAWYEPEFGGVHNIWVAGDTLYMGAYNAGFHAFDVSGELRGDLRSQGREIASFYPMDPKGRVPNTTMTWGVVVNPKDGLAYVNDMSSGLWIVRLQPRDKVVP